MKNNSNLVNFKTIYIAGINRSGGSLLSRLYDSHTKILSYPTELGFPLDNNFYEITDSYAGIPQTIPHYDKNKQIDAFELLEIPKTKQAYSTEWGKEKSDPLGIRENYLEKNFYGNIKTYFDHDLFTKTFSELSVKASNIKELYDARHYSYFNAWENGKYLNNQSHVVMQDSGGIYLTNIDQFFNDFKDSIIIYPIRDIVGYVAAEKVRYARRFYGSRRFAWPQLPNFFVKKYDYYDIESQIKGWLTAITRVRLLQEQFGVEDKFITYNHTNITFEPKKTMETLIKKSGLDYEDTLIKPTIAGNNWLGNSHYGPTKGISNNISKNYNKVLRDDEFDKINSLTDKFSEYLNDKITPISLLDIPENIFYDYKLQKRYLFNKKEITLYYALINSTKRRNRIMKVPRYAFLAILYSIFVKITHLPRMFKLKYIKGRGKQNYT